MTQTATALQLTDRQTADFEMIGNGGFALTGPQGYDEWKSVVENMTLVSGEYWPIPIRWPRTSTSPRETPSR